MALTRVLQACTKESWFPKGVLCDVAPEMQGCMAPLLALNSNKIVEASLLSPIGGECRTCPTPEEEDALLGDIECDIKCEIELPQVPEPLEVCEQVQQAEQTTTPTASLPSPPSQPDHLPSQKAKKSLERATRADAISAAQWVQAYLEENDMVPKWWREIWCLLLYPSDSPIQKLACQQAMAFKLPTIQLRKDGWWIPPPCLEVLGCRKYLPPKDFHRRCDYLEVRKKEMVALPVALQSCAVRSGMTPGVLCSGAGAPPMSCPLLQDTIS